MKYILVLSFIICFSQAAFSQTWGDSSLKNGRLFYSVEVAPKFPGGLSGYYLFLAKALKMPDNKYAKFSNKSVTVRIIIDTTGKVVFAEIEKGLNNAYNNAALEMIKQMPDWTPALQNNHPVPVTLSLPLRFVD